MNNDPMARRSPYQVSAPKYSVAHHMRSRNVIANFGAALQTLVGGNITAWSSLCEQARSEAFEIMIQHATELNANAVICARYDATEISSGVTEVLAYGTAVIVEPLDGSDSYLS